MKGVEKVFSLVATGMLYLATTCLLAMTALVVVSSFMRYIAGAPFGFTEELVALLYMGMVFLAIPIATVRHVHVSISVLPQRITDLLRHPFRLAAAAAMIVFSVWFVVVSYGVVAQSYGFASRSEQAEILLWPWMALIPVTMGFVAIISVLDLVTIAAGRDDEESVDQHAAGDAL